MAKRQFKKISADASSDPKRLTSKTVTRDLVVSPSFVTIYANDTQLQTTPWDIRFVFGEMSVEPRDGEVVMSVKQVAEVRMSPQHAKRVATILLEQLQSYEASFGPIPQPAE